LLSLFPGETRSFTGYLPRPVPPSDYKLPTRFPPIHLADKISLDLETHQLDPRRGGYIVGAAVTVTDKLYRDPMLSEYYPIRHADGPNLEPTNVLSWLRDELKRFKGELVGANVGLFDGDFLQLEGITAPQAKFKDVQWAEALLDEYCISPEMRVLTDTFEWKKSKDLKINEVLVGFEEYPRACKLKWTYRQFKRAEITGLKRLRQPSLRITTDKGIVVCSTKHRWLAKKDSHGWAKKHNEYGYCWLQANELQKGMQIARACNTWETDLSWESGYLAAVFDGEGWTSRRESMGFAQKPNELADNAKAFLKDRKFSIRVAKNNPDSPDCKNYLINGGREEIWRFLGSVRPARLLAKYRRDYPGLSIKSPSVKPAIILAIEELGEQEVISIQTTTKTLIVEGLLSHNSNSYSLETLAQKYLGEGKDTSLENLYGPEWKKHFREVHPAHARPYAIRDTILPLRVLDAQTPLLAKDKLTRLFDLECRLTPLLLDMKMRGVRVDLEKAEELEIKLSKLRDEAVQKMEKLAGFPVDFNSGPQIAVACDKLGIPYERTEKGNPSFRKAPGIGADLWIERQTNEFLKQMFSARFYEDLRNTFVRGYILDGNINGRIHGRFHPLKSDDGGTVSGRFSSSDPNLQNIPFKTALGREIRALFLPEEGMDWLAGDYSQIEFRLLVHYGVKYGCRGADVAQKMYRDNPETDFHDMVAQLSGLPRKDAKNANFMIIYGGGREKAAEMFGKSLAETDKILAKYEKKVPFAKQMYWNAQNEAKDKGFIRTILGRLGRFTNGESPHKALNKLVQGSAADLIKLAMVHLWDNLGPKALMHVTVHDEEGRSVEKGEAGQKAAKQHKEIMENALKLEVPVLADVKTGANWSEAK
jgi:DNA polymerase I-like protein with 3'-5' exonuclease and polymerase domains